MPSRSWSERRAYTKVGARNPDGTAVHPIKSAAGKAGAAAAQAERRRPAPPTKGSSRAGGSKVKGRAGGGRQWDSQAVMRDGVRGQLAASRDASASVSSRSYAAEMAQRYAQSAMDRHPAGSPHHEEARQLHTEATQRRSALGAISSMQHEARGLVQERERPTQLARQALRAEQARLTETHGTPAHAAQEARVDAAHRALRATQAAADRPAASRAATPPPPAKAGKAALHAYAHGQTHNSDGTPKPHSSGASAKTPSGRAKMTGRGTKGPASMAAVKQGPRGGLYTIGPSGAKTYVSGMGGKKGKR